MNRSRKVVRTTCLHCRTTKTNVKTVSTEVQRPYPAHPGCAPGPSFIVSPPLHPSVGWPARIQGGWLMPRIAGRRHNTSSARYRFSARDGKYAARARVTAVPPELWPFCGRLNFVFKGIICTAFSFPRRSSLLALSLSDGRLLSRP